MDTAAATGIDEEVDDRRCLDFCDVLTAPVCSTDVCRVEVHQQLRQTVDLGHMSLWVRYRLWQIVLGQECQGIEHDTKMAYILTLTIQGR